MLITENFLLFKVWAHHRIPGLTFLIGFLFFVVGLPHVRAKATWYVSLSLPTLLQMSYDLKWALRRTRSDRSTCFLLRHGRPTKQCATFLIKLKAFNVAACAFARRRWVVKLVFHFIKFLIEQSLLISKEMDLLLFNKRAFNHKHQNRKNLLLSLK